MRKTQNTILNHRERRRRKTIEKRRNTFEDLVRWIDGEVLVAVVFGGASGRVSHGLIGFEVTELQRERER